MKAPKSNLRRAVAAVMAGLVGFWMSAAQAQNTALFGRAMFGDIDPLPVNRLGVNYDFFGGGGFAIQQTFVGEWTFGGGNASIGVRLPAILYPGGPALNNVTVVGKWAFFDDPVTGNLLSAGLAVSIPVGGTTTLQPFFGFQVPMGDRLGGGFAEGAIAHGVVTIINPLGVAGGNVLTADFGLDFTLPEEINERLAELFPRFNGPAVISPELRIDKPLGDEGIRTTLSFGAEFFFNQNVGVYGMVNIIDATLGPAPQVEILGGGRIGVEWFFR
jgi:hypothetical protein